MKKFKLGFIVGRFQMLHKGHEQLINEGLERCERFVVLLGNSEESRTEKNPFNFEERKEMIERIYGDQIEVYPIINIGIGYKPEWGNYVMNTIKFYCGSYPDFVIRGSDDGRSQWIDKTKYTQLTEFIVSRDLIHISATYIREELKKYVNYIEQCMTYRENNNNLLANKSYSEADKVYDNFKSYISHKYTGEDLKYYGRILLGVI